MASLLSTAALNLRNVLANGRRYEVPPFQRIYSWTEEQWEDVWLDLEALERNARQHYMGALVLQEVRADEFRVIDGQQRLATLSIIVVAALHCLRELAQRGLEPEENERRLQGLRKSFLGDEHPATLKTTPKLRLNDANRRFYEGTLLDLREPVSARALPPSERPLWEALVYFRDRLRARFVDAGDGEGLAAFIYDTMSTRLLFIVVNVEDELGAYTVFETLNARGLELTSADLIKNYLMSLVHPTGDGNLQAALLHWGAITERVPARSLPAFLRHFLNSRGPLVRHDRVYRSISSEVTGPEQVFALLRELEDAATINEALEDAGHALWHEYPGAADHIDHLQMYQVQVYKPLIFAAWRQNLGADTIVRLLRICDVISFRYNVIAQRNPNRLEEAYNQAALGVHDGKLRSAADVQRSLSSVYVDDEPFREAFAKRAISAGGSRRRIVRYILCALEKQMHNADLDADTTAATIEHILPEHPSDEWWQWFRPEFHERYVRRLGNYLLLEGKLNRRAAGNAPLAQKKAVYAQSQYPSTRAFDPEVWTPDAMEARQAGMARCATAIWRL